MVVQSPQHLQLFLAGKLAADGEDVQEVAAVAEKKD